MTESTTSNSAQAPDRPISWRQLPAAVKGLVVAAFVNQLGAFIFIFLLTWMVTDLGADLRSAGFVLSAFGVATIVSRLVGGVVADRIGYRTTVVGGLLLCSVAQFGLAATQTFQAATVAAIVLGLVYKLFEAPSQALTAYLTPPAAQPVAFGLTSGALAAGSMIAGLGAAAFGSAGFRWLFLADAVTTLFCALLIFALVRGTARPPTPPRSTSAKDRPSPWRSPVLLGLLFTGTAFAFVYLQTTIALPLAVGATGSNPTLAGILLATSALIQLASQPLLGRLHSPFLIPSGFALVAVGLSGMAGRNHLWELAVSTVVWSLGMAVLLGRLLTRVSGYAPAAERGLWFAIYGTCWSVAGAVGPLISTNLLAVSLSVYWLTAGALAALLALVELVVASRGRRVQREVS